MLRSAQLLKTAERFLSRAMPFYVVNAFLPPLLLLLLSRVSEELTYAALWPLTAYCALCILSIALLQASRTALSERSFESVRKLLLATGILGLFTGLLVGGLLALRARAVALQAAEAKSVKKRTAEGAS